MHKICFTISLFHSSTCFEHHVLIVRRSKSVLYSLWYHHTYRWPSRAQVERARSAKQKKGKMCCENNCDNFLAGTLQYKCSQFRCCHGQNSNPVFGEHKPLKFPLILLALCGDTWIEVWTAALQFVHFVFERNCTSGVCFREVFSGAVRRQ